MTQRASESTQRRPWTVMLIVLMVVVMGTQWAAAATDPVEGTNYELGNYACLGDYADVNCTANDLGLHRLSPTVTDICETIGDTATATFLVTFESAQPTRYDLGVFISTDGGFAADGNYTQNPLAECYHDYLQEATTYNPYGSVDLTSGYGDFENLDNDDCADLSPTTTAMYYTQVPVTITCVDNDQDGIVDPLSVCTSYDNNGKPDCLTVTDQGAGTVAKCECGLFPLSPPILLYQGYDWGDLPVSYGTLLADEGPRHAIQDPTNTGTPTTITDMTSDPAVVYPAVWLGPSVDYSPNAETNGQPTEGADGDDTNTVNDVDDEDGVTYLGSWSALTGGQFSVFVNSSDGTCTGCRLGFWIDWDNNGVFGTGESYVQSVGPGANTVSFAIPSMPPTPLLYARFRLYDGNYTGTPSPTGLVTNGEVEDFRFDISPTAVDLLYFEAEGAKKSVVLSWATSNEIDNAGFNLYRAKSVGAERIKLNEELILSNVYPGSPSGASYEWVDTTVKGARTYYYWLEDVEFGGDATLHGPVSASAVVGKAK